MPKKVPVQIPKNNKCKQNSKTLLQYSFPSGIPKFSQIISLASGALEI